jgi:hypothetical protein
VIHRIYKKYTTAFEIAQDKINVVKRRELSSDYTGSSSSGKRVERTSTQLSIYNSKNYIIKNKKNIHAIGFGRFSQIRFILIPTIVVKVLGIRSKLHEPKK